MASVSTEKFATKNVNSQLEDVQGSRRDSCWAQAATQSNESRLPEPTHTCTIYIPKYDTVEPIDLFLSRAI